MGIKEELVEDENSRTDVVIMFYLLNDLFCGWHYLIYQSDWTGQPKLQLFIEQMELIPTHSIFFLSTCIWAGPIRLINCYVNRSSKKCIRTDLASQDIWMCKSIKSSRDWLYLNFNGSSNTISNSSYGQK